MQPDQQQAPFGAHLGATGEYGEPAPIMYPPPPPPSYPLTAWKSVPGFIRFVAWLVALSYVVALVFGAVFALALLNAGS